MSVALLGWEVYALFTAVSIAVGDEWCFEAGIVKRVLASWLMLPTMRRFAGLQSATIMSTATGLFLVLGMFLSPSSLVIHQSSTHLLRLGLLVLPQESEPVTLFNSLSLPYSSDARLCLRSPTSTSPNPPPWRASDS